MFIHGMIHPCIKLSSTIGGDKGGIFKKPFLKFFIENLLN